VAELIPEFCMKTAFFVHAVVSALFCGRRIFLPQNNQA